MQSPQVFLTDSSLSFFLFIVVAIETYQDLTSMPKLVKNGKLKLNVISEGIESARYIFMKR
jgi:hypothetical protein